jgi:hypothetical protein
VRHELMYGDGSVEMQGVFKDGRPFMAALEHRRHAFAPDGLRAIVTQGILRASE